MALILYKWLMVPLWLLVAKPADNHPIYVSVVEMEHNAKEQTMEVTCRIFTDDFEKTLRDAYKVRIDLLKPEAHEAMGKLVDDYVRQHLKVTLNGKPVSMKFNGYEEVEEAIYSYFHIDAVPEVRSVEIEHDILYAYKKEQMGIFHITVNSVRKSSRLLNPDRMTRFTF